MIGFPLDSHVTYEDGVPVLDRAVSSAPLRKLIKSLFSDGVMPDSTSMLVSAKDGMTLEVSRGFAICNGCMKLMETEEVLALDPADSTYARIDKIVLRLDDNDDARSCELAVKKGNPAAAPISLGVNRNATVWEIALADVTVKSNATAITNADIKDLRFDSNLCGVISSVSEFDTSKLYQQVQGDLAGFKEEEQAAFIEWFSRIKDQLSTDAAGNLQTQIMTERARIDGLVAQKSNEVAESAELTFAGSKTECTGINVINNGLCAELYINNLKWTSNQSGYDTIATFPESLLPLTQSKEGVTARQVIYDSDDIQIMLRDYRLQVFRKTGTPVTHTCMLAYALKNPVMSELSDIRNGADGNVYESAGEAIRAQIRNIEGFDAVVDVAAKMNAKNAVGSGSFSVGRKSGTTVGSASATLGASNTASGNWSTASGYGNTASAQCSTAMGMNNTASGNQSTALGSGNAASGYESFACNSGNTASGNCSFAAGNFNEALTHQMATGHYNDISLALENSKTGTSDGTAFVIGNGTSSAKSNAFRVTGNGEVFAKAAYQSTGADLAELREWADGNPNNEDKRGYFVTMEGLNIRIAEPGDYVCGIISANPCLIGNADEAWMGRYVFDDFGAIVYETAEETDEETGETITYKRYKTNPEYNPELEYVHRKDRPEWDFVGLTGVIAVRDDGSCEVNGFCRCGKGGIATKSDRGYRVLERVNNNIVKVLFYLTGEVF